MTLDQVTITISDIRKVGFCARGARKWFPQHGIPFNEFLANGISAQALVDTGDELAIRVVTAKIEREGLVISG